MREVTASRPGRASAGAENAPTEVLVATFERYVGGQEDVIIDIAIQLAEGR